jgi:hypothetical protein
VDGDGVGEVVGGSFDRHVYLFSGASGDTIWTFDTGNRLFAVAGVPDLSGNGAGDVLGGTQYLNSGGRAYALEGGDDVTAAPDLPAAAGVAKRRSGTVTLAWHLSAPLPCVVDRIAVADGTAKMASSRRDLARAFERGDLDTRGVLAAITTTKAATGGIERLTPVPVVPDGAADGGWRYTWSDPQAGEAAVRYRISVVGPDGVEATVLELAPGTADLPAPTVREVRVVPNPFNPRTELRLDLARAAAVTVDVHDARGRRVGRLGPVARPAGESSLAWDGTGFGGRPLASGTYLLRVAAGGQAWTVRATVAR